MQKIIDFLRLFCPTTTISPPAPILPSPSLSLRYNYVPVADDELHFIRTRCALTASFLSIASPKMIIGA